MRKIILFVMLMPLGLNFSFKGHCEPVLTDIQVHYSKNLDGSKIYGQQWFEAKSLGIVNMSLDYLNFDQTLHAKGFDLDKASSFRIVIPQMYADCNVTLKGSLSPSTDGKQPSPVSLKFEGESCKSTFDILPFSKPIHLSFFNVPAYGSSTLKYPQVELEIIDLPLNKCGLTGAVQERISDCKLLNNSLSNRVSKKSKPWSLIMYDEKGNRPTFAWFDISNSLSWGMALEGIGNQQKAIEQCSQQKLFNLLPSDDDVEKSRRNGLFEIFSQYEDSGAFWSSSIIKNPRDGEIQGYWYSKTGGDYTDPNQTYKIRCVS